MDPILIESNIKPIQFRIREALFLISFATPRQILALVRVCLLTRSACQNQAILFITGKRKCHIPQLKLLFQSSLKPTNERSQPASVWYDQKLNVAKAQR